MQSDGWQLQAFEDFVVECHRVLWEERVRGEEMEKEIFLPSFHWAVVGLKAMWGDFTPDVDTCGDVLGGVVAGGDGGAVGGTGGVDADCHFCGDGDSATSAGATGPEVAGACGWGQVLGKRGACGGVCVEGDSEVTSGRT